MQARAEYSGDYNYSDLLPQQKAIKVFEVKAPSRVFPGELQTQGGGVTDWNAAQEYAFECRKWGITGADIHIVPPRPNLPADS